MTWDHQTIAAAVPVAAVAVFAGVVSYTHVYALAVRTDQGGVAAHLLPLSLDGLIVAGSVLLLAGFLLGWLGVALGVLGTLYANVVSMLPHGHLSATIASWPAISFAIATFLLERWIKRQVSRVAEGGSEVAQSSATNPDLDESHYSAEPPLYQPEPVASRGGQGGTESEKKVADLPSFSATPEPAPSPLVADRPQAGQCGHTVAGTPEENVGRRTCTSVTASARRPHSAASQPPTESAG